MQSRYYYLRQLKRLGQCVLGLILLWMHTHLLAIGKLPQLPDDERITDGKGIISVFTTWIVKLGKPGIIAVGVLIFAMLASGVSGAYKDAQEQDKMGRFWTAFFAALAAAAFTLTLLYAAWEMIGAGT